MQKIAQVEDKEVMLAVRVHESRRRYLKSKAATLGKDMGTVVEEALDAHIGPPPPEILQELESDAA